MKWTTMATAFAACLTASLAAAAAEPIELQWWHAMTSVNADRVNKIAADFNASQAAYKVVPVFKGSYAETMNAGVAAYRAGNAPHIIQIFEVGTATMMAAKGAVKPVYQLMAEAGEPFDPNAYLPAVTAYYSTADGKMLSLPFNSSTAITYWNKDAFKKAGLDPDKAPATWPDTLATAREAARRRHPLRPDRGVDQLDADRAVQRLAQHPAGDQGERARRCRCRARIQQPDRRQAHPQPRRGAEGQELRLWRADERARGQVPQRRVRDDPDLVRRLRDLQGRRQIRFRHGRAALLPGCRRGAAELDHRRRQPVGHGRQEARGIQGCGQVFHLPVADRSAAGAARGDRLSADHQGRLRGDQGVRVLRQEPGPRDPDHPDDGKAADREFARAAPRQSGADPRHHRRGSGSGLRRQGGRASALDDAVKRGNGLLRQFERNTQ